MASAFAAELALARDLAARASHRAWQMRQAGVEVERKSTPTDLVTAADRATEDFIRSELARLRPGDGFYGEESGAQQSTTGFTWVIDPIDGTVNYAHNIPAWAPSVAVVRHDGPADPASWQVVAGAVANPSLHEVWFASLDGGAFLDTAAFTGPHGLSPTTPVPSCSDKRPASVPSQLSAHCSTPSPASSVSLASSTPSSLTKLQLSDSATLSRSLVATGFAYDAAVRVEQARVVAELIGQVADIRRMGAASLHLTAGAAGRVAGYFDRGLHPYDHAAGALIAAEAGAVIAGPRGTARMTEEFAFAAHPAVAEDLRQALTDAGAPA